MPPQPVIPKWIRTVLHVTHETSAMMFPINFQYTGGASSISESLLSDLNNHVLANLIPGIQALMSNSYVYTNLDSTDRSIVGGAYSNLVLAITGGITTGDPLPSNCADVISWRTGLSGRSNRGRTYTFGATDAQATGSIWTSGYTTLVGNLAASLVAYVGPLTCPVTTAVASVKDLEMKPITGYIIDSFVDSQRRRLPGRGG